MNKNLLIGGSIGAATGFAAGKLFKANKWALIATTVILAAAGAYVGNQQ